MQKWMLPCVAALAACGEVKGDGQLADAPTSIDAELPPLPVKVTVLSVAGDGQPDRSAKVVFRAPDDAVIADVAVDANGKAEAMMPNGGSVLAIRVTTDTPTQLTSLVTAVLAVKPGDDLTIGLKEAATNLSGGGETTMTANFTANQAAATAAFFTPCTPNGDTGDPIKGVATLRFRDSCRGDKFDLLGIASGGNLAAPQYLRLANVAYAGGGTFSIPGAFVTMPTFTASYTNVPDAITGLTLTRSSILGNTSVAPQQGTQFDPPAGAASATTLYPPGVGTRAEVNTLLSRADATGQQSYLMRTDTVAASAAIDLATLPLPWLSDVKATPTGATWTALETGALGDGQLSQWAGRWLAGEVATSVVFRMIQPAQTTGVTLPRLPSNYARLDPQQQTAAVTATTFIVVMADYDKINGYDGFRPLGENLVATTSTTMNVFVGEAYRRRTSSAAFILRQLQGALPSDPAALLQLASPAAR